MSRDGGTPSHSKIDGLGDGRGRIPVETNVASQRDVIATQHEGAGSSIEHQAVHRDTREVIAICQLRVAGKDQAGGKARGGIPVTSRAPIVIRTQAGPGGHRRRRGA